MEERAGFEPAITELQSVALPTWLTLQYGAAHRIRTCKSFRTNGFQDRFLTNPDMQQNKRHETDPAFQPESIRLSLYS